MTDYKGLCRELVWLDQAEPGDYADWRQAWNAAIERARAALTKPEPEGPTDNELEEEFGRALLKLPGDSMNATAVAFARAVLARWGK